MMKKLMNKVKAVINSKKPLLIGLITNEQGKSSNRIIIQYNNKADNPLNNKVIIINWIIKTNRRIR